jgi:hypothetical protein
MRFAPHLPHYFTNKEFSTYSPFGVWFFEAFLTSFFMIGQLWEP